MEFITSNKKKEEKNKSKISNVSMKIFIDHGGVRYLIDQIDILCKDKEKIMKLFEELREKRGPNDLVTKEQKKLVNKIFFF